MATKKLRLVETTKDFLVEIKSAIGINEAQSLLGFLLLIFTLTTTEPSVSLLTVCTVFLALGIASAVHSADVIAKRVGPSLGTLILAIAVTIIEVALIINLMKSNPESSHTLARDTVFAAIMIVTNGITGFSILLGGMKQKELGFQAIGTSSLMAVLVTLAIITMVLPNFTTSTVGPTYNNAQLIAVSLFALIIYASLVWSQTRSHKDFFEPISSEQFKKLEDQKYIPSKIKAIISFVGLIVSLTVVVGLAKVLSPSILAVVNFLESPKSSVGIIVAILVLAPETFSALNSAKANQIQTSFNLALGSGVASIALTIPVVTMYSIIFEQTLTLGLDSKSMLFLALTFIAGSFTFGTGRTTALHGIVHIIILLCYIIMSFIP